MSPGNGNSEMSSLITARWGHWPSSAVVVNHIYVPPALHPKSSSRVEVTAYARVCMSVCLLGDTVHQEAQLIVVMRAKGKLELSLA